MLLRIEKYCDPDERKLMDIYSESNFENTDSFFSGETNTEIAVQKSKLVFGLSEKRILFTK